MDDGAAFCRQRAPAAQSLFFSRRTNTRFFFLLRVLYKHYLLFIHFLGIFFFIAACASAAGNVCLGRCVVHTHWEASEIFRKKIQTRNWLTFFSLEKYAPNGRSRAGCPRVRNFRRAV